MEGFEGKLSTVIGNLKSLFESNNRKYRVYKKEWARSQET